MTCMHEQAASVGAWYAMVLVPFVAAVMQCQ